MVQFSFFRIIFVFVKGVQFLQYRNSPFITGYFSILLLNGKRQSRQRAGAISK